MKTVVQRFATSDIDEANRHPPPGWTQVVYRLGEGPFRHEAVPVDLGDGLELEHARFVGGDPADRHARRGCGPRALP